MKIWEIWAARDGSESACFLAQVCTDEQYYLLTHTVYDVPMEFVGSFAERSTRRAFDASRDILHSEEGVA